MCETHEAQTAAGARSLQTPINNSATHRICTDTVGAGRGNAWNLMLKYNYLDPRSVLNTGYIDMKWYRYYYQLINTHTVPRTSAHYPHQPHTETT